MLPVEIVYFGEEKTFSHVCLTVPDGASVMLAVEMSGLLTQFPEIRELGFSVFGQIVQLDEILKAGDRIEILRPLKIDPMTKRRIRAKKM